jgi:hypothetical protein
VKEMHPLAKEKFDSLYDQKMWAYAVNIARLYILYKYGGIYMDTDIHMTKNASLNMLPLEKDLILVHPGKYKNKNKIRFQNCVLCASKNNAFIKKVYDRIGTQGYSVLGGGGGEHPLYEKYSTTYLTSEYHIHTSKKKHGMNNYPAICFDRRRIIVPETDCILDPNYFFGPKPLIATHLDMASHNVFKRYKFIKDLGTPTP